MPTAAAQGVVRTNQIVWQPGRCCKGLLVSAHGAETADCITAERAVLAALDGTAVPLYRLWLIWMPQADYRYRQRCYLQMAAKLH